MPIHRSSIPAALCSLFLLAAGAQAAAPCATRDSCLDAIMDAARDGRQIEEMALLRRLPRDYGTRAPLVPAQGAGPQVGSDTGSDAAALGAADADLIGMLRDAKNQAPTAPERRRALALAYLQANRLAEAELELDEAIANQPTHAPFWLDLALVYARQGRTAKAAAALVVADDWTADAAALRQAYARSAQDSTPPGAGAAYAQALQLIGARKALLAQREAALAPRQLVKGPDGKFPPMPTILFDRCAKPAYPRSSLRNEETGAVTLNFLIDADGKPVQINKIRSSGHADLDNAALLSLSACPFKPLVAEGKPTAAWATIQYVWTMD